MGEPYQDREASGPKPRATDLTRTVGRTPHTVDALGPLDPTVAPRRVHLCRRPLRLRQVHVPAHRRGPAAPQHGRAGDPHVERAPRRHDLPGLRHLLLKDRGREVLDGPEGPLPKPRPRPLPPRHPSPTATAGAPQATIAAGTPSAQYVAPLQVALDKDEFEKEDPDVELKVPPTPDALPLLTKGDIDTLWARLSEGESANRVTMAGRKLGTTIGKGSVIAYPMGKALREAPYRSHGR